MGLTIGDFKKRIINAVDFNPRLTPNVMLTLVKDRIRDIAQETQAFRRAYDVFVGTNPVEREFRWQTTDSIISCEKVLYGTSEDFDIYNQTFVQLDKNIDYEFDFHSDLAATVQGFVLRLHFEPESNYYIRVITSNIPDVNALDAIWLTDTEDFLSVIPETFIDPLIKGVIYLWKKEYDRDPLSAFYQREYEGSRDKLGAIRGERIDLV
jgi:hypothetical protein